MTLRTPLRTSWRPARPERRRPRRRHLRAPAKVGQEADPPKGATRLGLALALGFALALPLSAGRADERGPTVTVTGEAEAQVKPDEAAISLSTNVEKPTAAAAQDENARVAAAVVEGLRGAGVAEADIRTTSLTLFPQYAQFSSGAQGAVTGYHAAETFEVRVRAMDKAGALEAAAVDRGALPVGAIRFDISDRAQREDALRGAAVENARHRAELYAKGAGMKLGALVSIVAGGAAPPAPLPRTYAGYATAAASFESGQLTLRETVNVTYALVAP